MKIEQAVEKSGGEIVYRENRKDGELYVADVFSAYPHENLAPFLKRIGVCDDLARDYPMGCFVTLWWLKGNDFKLPAGIGTFDPFHDHGTPAERRNLRVGAMVKKARKVLQNGN